MITKRWNLFLERLTDKLVRRHHKRQYAVIKHTLCPNCKREVTCTSRLIVREEKTKCI